MQLSPHFSMSELLVTSTGMPNVPDEAAIERLRALCTRLLEPVRTILGVPLRVTSGYRSPEVNTAIGGSPTSQHMRGDAADVVPVGMTAEEAVVRIAREHEAGRLPHLDQLIVYPSGFIHLSTSTRPRGQLLRSLAPRGSRGPYVPWRSTA